MKRILVATAAIAALALPAAASAGNGTTFQSCFGTTYGQSKLVYGQFKQDPAHPASPGGGLPGLLAAHGPNGAAPLCNAG
jgi:hypothetical protein